MTTDNTRERRVRRRLDRVGFRLWKVRENSRYHWEYGPFAIINNDRNMVVLHGLTIDQVETWLDEDEAA